MAKCPSLLLSSLNIISIVSKCPNIRSLYLNQDLGLETIKSMAQICGRLECLCFGQTVFKSESTHLKKIGILFAERVVHLSIEWNFENVLNDGKVIELIKHFTSLQSLKIIYSKPLNNILNFVAKNLKSLNIINTGFGISAEEEEEDINSLMSYINRNNRCLESLHISDYHISEELFETICSQLDLKQLSINCQLLTLSSLVRILCKSQQNLSKLTSIGLLLEDSVFFCDRHFPKVRSLRLNWCDFEVNSFIEFLKLFRFLEKLDFGRLYFICECNPTENDSHCEECNQKCLKELLKSKTLKVLTMRSPKTNLSSIWQSFTRNPNLEKLRLLSVSEDDCKQLAKNLVEVLSEKSTKYFTLEFSHPIDRTNFIDEIKQLCHEIPRNLRIIC